MVEGIKHDLVHAEQTKTEIEIEGDQIADLEKVIEMVILALGPEDSSVVPQKINEARDLAARAAVIAAREKAFRERRKVPFIRGVDYECEACRALKGSTLEDGWHRCNECGYPSS